MEMALEQACDDKTATMVQISATAFRVERCILFISLTMLLHFQLLICSADGSSSASFVKITEQYPDLQEQIWRAG